MAAHNCAVLFEGRIGATALITPPFKEQATYAGSRGTGSPSLLFREDSFLDSTDARR